MAEKTANLPVIEPDLPKIPRGIALMIRNILGIDPEMLFAQFQLATKTMMDFCRHFDGRMSMLTQEVGSMDKHIQERFTRQEAMISELLLRLTPSEITEDHHGRNRNANTNAQDGPDTASTSGDATRHDQRREK